MNSPAAFEHTRIWHERFMALAYHIAQYSKDPKRKVGAVLVTPDRRSIAIGYNGFTRRFLDTDERLNDPEIKNQFMVHAERNALDNAKFGMRGTTIYSTRFPCLECMKGIVQTGVEQVVAPYPDFDHPRWGKSHQLSQQLMKEVSIKYYRLDAVLDVTPEREVVAYLLEKIYQLSLSGKLEEQRKQLQALAAEYDLTL